MQTFYPRQIVVERRACDVCIVGHSPSAYYAAQFLRSQRKSVIIIERLNESHTEPYLRHPALLSIHSPDVDPGLYGVAAASAPMWRQLYDYAGAQKKLTLTDSLDAGLVGDLEDAEAGPSPSSPQLARSTDSKDAPTQQREKAAVAPPRIRASTMQRLVRTCELLGISHTPLTSAQVAAMYPGLSLHRKEHVAIRSEDALSFEAGEALAILRAMARKTGTEVRERCRLVGLRDLRGSAFQLKIAAEGQDLDLTLIEAEQVLVMGSDPLVPKLIHDAFGVSFGGVAPLALLEGRAAIPPGLTKVPILRYHRDYREDGERPEMRGGWSTFSPRSGAVDYLMDPPSTSDGWHEWDQVTGHVDRDTAFGRDLRDASTARERAEVGSKRKEAQELRRTEIEMRLGQGEAAVAAVMRGRAGGEEIGPLGTGRERITGLVSADGRPLLGALPGMEEGRLVLASCAASPASPPLAEVRLGPLLGQWAARATMLMALPEGAIGAFRLDREPLATKIDSPRIDAWDEWSPFRAAQPAISKQGAKKP